MNSGQSFTRDLLKAIIPKNCANMLETTLYNLCKQQFFECGSLQLHASHQRSQSSHLMVSENAAANNTAAGGAGGLGHHHHHGQGNQYIN